MKKSLLSIVVAAASLSVSAATYEGTISGTLETNSFSEQATVVIEGSTLTIQEFTYQLSPVQKITFSTEVTDMTVTKADGKTNYTSTLSSHKIGQMGAMSIKATGDLSGTETDGNLTLNYSGTATMTTSPMSLTFSFVGKRTDSDEDEDAELPEGVYFIEDFEWLEPWATVGNGTACGSTVETDDPNANAPQLATPKVDGVSAYDALLAKGYEIIATHAASKTERKPEAQTYLQTNYLKFGLTGYYSGIIIPVRKDVPADVALKLSFDWCSMRQGSGTWDPTEIVVIVTTDGTTTQYPVAVWNFEKGAEYKWLTETISLNAGTIKKGSTITIRNADSQWPVEGSAPALRWFLDNVKLCDATLSGIDNVEVEEADATAPVEYYNLQGIRVAADNLPAGLYIRRQGSNATKILVR